MKQERKTGALLTWPSEWPTQKIENRPILRSPENRHNKVEKDKGGASDFSIRGAGIDKLLQLQI